MLKSYDPFTYQPMMKAYYMGRQFPQQITALQAANPDKSAHIGAVYQFSNWLQQDMPDLYSQLRISRPDLLNAGAVVMTGKLAPNTAKNVKGLAGLGDYVIDPITGDVTNASSSGGAVSPYNSNASIFTEWGKTITDFAGKYLQYDTQKKLLETNLKRAEQGLPPIDAASYGMGVNVGLSPATQQLVIYSLIGLGVFAAFSAVSKRR